MNREDYSITISVPIETEKIVNFHFSRYKSKRKAMNRNWRNQKANPALKTKTGNK